MNALAERRQHYRGRERQRRCDGPRREGAIGGEQFVEFDVLPRPQRSTVLPAQPAELTPDMLPKIREAVE